MEKQVDVLMNEKAYCHTYDSLVRELSSRMEIDDEKILPKEGDKFDYEDINSWISAVDFIEGKVPNLEAGLSAEKGKNPVTISVLEQETIKSADEKVSNESLLYSMALTEAKMKVISDIAEETYPAVAFQISDYRKEMEKMREEILGSKETTSSLDEILARMPMKRGFMMSTLIVSGMILAACGYTPVETPIYKSPTPFQPEVTVTSPANETPNASETPFVDATPTATEVVVRTEFAKGEMMTLEELKANVDWYYNLTNEELSALTKDKLWSFNDYKGDSRPRDIDGKILSETQDLGFLFVKRQKFSAPVMEEEIAYYNAIYLGTTKIMSDGVEYYVGGFGMKTPDGKKIVVYGTQALKGMPLSGGAVMKVDLYGRSFGFNNASSVNPEEYVANLLNKHQKDVVIVETIKLLMIEGGLTENAELFEKLLGDERLFELMMKQFNGEIVDPMEYFEALLNISDNKLRATYDPSEFQNFSDTPLILVGE